MSSTSSSEPDAAFGADPPSTRATSSSHPSLVAPLHSAISRKEFEADTFEAKSWINAQIRASGGGSASGSSSSAVVQTLVMKLQLMSADVQSSLAQSSTELFAALPKSARGTHNQPSTALHHTTSSLFDCAALLCSWYVCAAELYAS